jgi:hypothetical protein
MKRVIFAVAAASIVAGCAQQGVETSSSQYEEKEYRVGSNLPVKRGSAPDSSSVTTISADDMERARNSSLNPGAQLPPVRAGGH